MLWLIRLPRTTITQSRDLSRKLNLSEGSFRTLQTRDIWDEIEPSGRIRAEFSMSEEITRLREAGLMVYAGVKEHVIEGGVKAPEPWPIACIVIYRSDDKSIKASPTKK